MTILRLPFTRNFIFDTEERHTNMLSHKTYVVRWRNGSMDCCLAEKAESHSDSEPFSTVQRLYEFSRCIGRTTKDVSTRVNLLDGWLYLRTTTPPPLLFNAMVVLKDRRENRVALISSPQLCGLESALELAYRSGTHDEWYGRLEKFSIIDTLPQALVAYQYIVYLYSQRLNPLIRNYHKVPMGISDWTRKAHNFVRKLCHNRGPILFPRRKSMEEFKHMNRIY